MWNISIAKTVVMVFFSKIHRYSSTDTGKTWDKPVNRRSNVRFNPVKVLEQLKNDPPPTDLDANAKRELVEKYLDVSSYLVLTVGSNVNAESQPRSYFYSNYVV